MQLQVRTLNDISLHDTSTVTIYLVALTKILPISAYLINEVTTLFQPFIPIPEKYLAKMNDSYPQRHIVVDILIGIGDAIKLLLYKQIRIYQSNQSDQKDQSNQSIILLNTLWGYVPAGKTCVERTEKHSTLASMTNMTATQKLAQLCSRSWTFYEYPLDVTDDALTSDELLAISSIKSLLKYDEKRGTKT